MPSLRKIVLALFVLAALFASFQSLLNKKKVYEPGGRTYTCYNNYVIFRQSHLHLAEGSDLYKTYPDEQWDRYKYSPVFALFFGLFSWLPDFAGLSLWNLLNALFLAFAVYALPGIREREKGLILLASSVELLTSLQNEQSNPMVAGLLILAFALLERNRYLPAVLCIVFSAYIKIFGLAGLVLFLFYPKKWKLALYTVMWTAILFVLPLVLTGFHTLLNQYQSWAMLLKEDHSGAFGISVMGLIHSWTGLTPNTYVVATAGLFLFLMPMLRVKLYTEYGFRLLMLCSLLIWVVIFNHMAESPTFIIAMAGVSIWFFTGKRTPISVALFILTVIFTSLSPSDLFPVFIREGFFKPWMVKVVPCILVWGVILWEQMKPGPCRQVPADGH